MKRDKGFSMETVRSANLKMILGIKPKYRISDKFSDDDIECALREASIRVGKFVMPEERKNDTAYSDVYTRLVKDDNDVAGQIAYSVYKRAKIEFIRKKHAELNIIVLPDDVLEEFYAAQTDYMLKLYRIHAKEMTREFLDESYGDDIEREKGSIEKEHNEKYEKLAYSVRPSFWYGVLQGIVASFLFVLSGYIILKMNGSWDILLSNLLK